MARITLRNDETESGMLPDVCMYCGKPSDFEKHIVYEWRPFWINFLAVLLCLGGVIYFVLVLVLNKKRAVYVPFCKDHIRYGETLLTVLLLTFAVVTCSIFGLLIVYGSDLSLTDQFLWAVFAAYTGLFFLFIVYRVRQALFVSVVRITEEDITLRNVHPDFVAALEEDRKYDWDVVE